jgi:hypothetical protein
MLEDSKHKLSNLAAKIATSVKMSTEKNKYKIIK